MEKLNYNNTPRFTFKNMTCKCKVLDIYDADTITVAFYLDNFNYTKISVRLLGIDTPELRGSEKELGIKARNHLIKILTDVIIDKDYSRNEIRDLIFNKNNNIVDILFDDFDKYGRPLGTIYKNNININEILIIEGYAKKYDGGTKEKW